MNSLTNFLCFFSILIVFLIKVKQTFLLVVFTYSIETKSRLYGNWNFNRLNDNCLYLFIYIIIIVGIVFQKI